MAAACSRMAETNHLAGGMQKKEYFRFGVRYFFRTDPASVGYSARELCQSVVPLRKSCKNGQEKGIAFLKKRVYNRKALLPLYRGSEQGEKKKQKEKSYAGNDTVVYGLSTDRKESIKKYRSFPTSATFESWYFF